LSRASIATGLAPCGGFASGGNWHRTPKERCPAEGWIRICPAPRQESGEECSNLGEISGNSDRNRTALTATLCGSRPSRTDLATARPPSEVAPPSPRFFVFDHQPRASITAIFRAAQVARPGTAAVQGACRAPTSAAPCGEGTRIGRIARHNLFGGTPPERRAQDLSQCAKWLSSPVSEVPCLATVEVMIGRALLAKDLELVGGPQRLAPNNR